MGSNPAEIDELFQDIKSPEPQVLQEEHKTVDPESEIFGSLIN